MHLLVSLFPLAIYLFFLAGLNRRDRPVMLHGAWEAVALLFAISGFLLYTAPGLLNDLYNGELLQWPIELTDEKTFDAIYSRWLLIWVVYYVAVVALAAMLPLKRLRCRGIYNVDLEGFRAGLVRTLEELALTSRAEGSTLFLAPAAPMLPQNPVVPESTEMGVIAAAHVPRPAPATASADGGPVGTVAILRFDVFPTLSHVSLCWVDADAAFRAAFEATLMRNLEQAVAHDNPSANWFIGVGSLLFGALFMLIALFAFGKFLPRRG
jgi:hypothetical protein